MPMTSMDVAVLRCMEICAEEGWLPSPEQTLALIRLRDEYRAGQRSEHAPTPDSDEARRDLRRLEWIRWLAQHGILSDS